MTRIGTFWGLILLTAVLSGCAVDDSAKQILQPTPPLSLASQLTDGRRLCKQGTLDFAEMVPVADGASIAVWAIRAKTDAPARGMVMIVPDGGLHTKADFLGAAKQLAKRGFDAVLLDPRGHGESTGQYMTYGAKEKHDLKAVADHLFARGYAGPVYLFGVTHGGSIALQYAAIDPRVQGVVAMAPWATMELAARRKLGLRLIDEEEFRAILDRAEELGEFDRADASAVSAAQHIDVPVLLIHGVLDLSVPLSDSQAIFEALPTANKKLKVVMVGPEQAKIGITWDSWVAEQIQTVAAGQLGQDEPAPTTEPAEPTSTPSQKTPPTP
jgi:alpha-beta hydrolase superfamily lysophospholipase